MCDQHICPRFLHVKCRNFGTWARKRKLICPLWKLTESGAPTQTHTLAHTHAELRSAQTTSAVLLKSQWVMPIKWFQVWLQFLKTSHRQRLLQYDIKNSHGAVDVTLPLRQAAGSTVCNCALATDWQAEVVRQGNFISTVPSSNKATQSALHETLKSNWKQSWWKYNRLNKLQWVRNE